MTPQRPTRRSLSRIVLASKRLMRRQVSVVHRNVSGFHPAAHRRFFVASGFPPVFGVMCLTHVSRAGASKTRAVEVGTHRYRSLAGVRWFTKNEFILWRTSARNASNSSAKHYSSAITLNCSVFPLRNLMAAVMQLPISPSRRVRNSSYFRSSSHVSLSRSQTRESGSWRLWKRRRQSLRG